MRLFKILDIAVFENVIVLNRNFKILVLFQDPPVI